MTEITVTVDGVNYVDHVEPRMLLVHYLQGSRREDRYARSDATPPTVARAPC